MRIGWRYVVLCVVLCLLSLPAAAGSPKLNDLLPVAGQRGQAVAVTFHGEQLHDVTSVLFHTQGIQASELSSPKKNKSKRVRATLTIAPDAPLGEHQVRLVTRTGVTELVTFHVVDRPIVNETPDESTKNKKRFTQSTSFDTPQAIELGTAVLGRTEPEDVDYFAVDLKKGQPFVAEVHGMRLGRGFTDSHLTVSDEQGRTVAECDDTLQLKQDPFVSFLAPRDGRYILTLRDAAYQGSTNNWYLLHVGVAIRPKLVYPLGGRPGQTLDLRMLDDVGGKFTQPVTLPPQPDPDYKIIAEYKGLRALSGLPFRVNDLPNVLENPTARNNGIKEALASKAHPLPVAFNGIIERRKDGDYYRVYLKKGQRATFRCYAQSMGSPLDSVVNVFGGAKNKNIKGNDDQAGLDSLVTIKAPEDGDYFVRVRDHRGRGGPDFVYRLEVTAAEPGVSTSITQYNRARPQERQTIAVPQGNRFATLVRVDRSEVTGDVRPVINGLPSGVTFEGLGPAEQESVMPVVFEAKNDAPIGAHLVDLQAQPKGDRANPTRSDFHQRIPLVVANPNRTEYYHTTTDTLPVAVTEAIPFKIDVVQPKAPLVHGGKQRLQIKLTRAPGYNKKVRLYLLYRPTGIGAPTRVDLNKAETQGVYEIDANDTTPTRDWPMVILARDNQPSGAVWASSQLFTVKVEAPFVSGTIDNAKGQQGQAIDIAVRLEHPRDWQGTGELKLMGLPANAKAKPITIKPGQGTAVFRVDLADNTPAGNHKSLMCELTVQVNGEPVIHRFGRGGRLRVNPAQAQPKDRTQTRDKEQG